MDSNNGHKRRQLPKANRDYFWCCAVHKIYLRPIVQGPHNTDTEARQWGYANMSDQEFEVLPFPTVNKQAARDFYKNILAQRAGNIDIVFKRAMYPKSQEERLQQQLEKLQRR